MEVDIELFEQEDIKKFTGPVEHWLTTLNQGFWALEEEYRDTWNNLEPGQVVFFHGSQPEYLYSLPTKIRNHNTGIIGMGIIGAKLEKEDDKFVGELLGKVNLNLTIYFNKIYWLGNINKIRDVPIEEKNEKEIQKDVSHLLTNVVDFGEMDAECNFRLPPQKSVFNVRETECLSRLVKNRVEETGTEVKNKEIEISSPEDHDSNKNDDTKGNEKNKSKRGGRDLSLQWTLVSGAIFGAFFYLIAKSGALSWFWVTASVGILTVLMLLFNSRLKPTFNKRLIIAAMISIALFGAGKYQYATHGPSEEKIAELKATKPVPNFTIEKVKRGNVTFVPSVEERYREIEETVWYFGDGSHVTVKGSSKVEHHYRFAGQQAEVTLQVIDVYGNKGKITKEVGIPPIGYQLKKPKFKIKKISSNKIRLTPSIDNELRNIKSLTWSFGDKSVKKQDLSKIEHKYNSAGIYDVKLQVADKYRNKASIKKEVIVKPSDYHLPNPEFDVKKQDTFKIKVSPRVQDTEKKIKRWQWKFGDNSQMLEKETGDPVTHKYNSPGDYSIELKVIDKYGGTGTVNNSVKIIKVNYDTKLKHFWKIGTGISLPGFSGTVVPFLYRGKVDFKDSYESISVSVTCNFPLLLSSIHSASKTNIDPGDSWEFEFVDLSTLVTYQNGEENECNLHITTKPEHAKIKSKRTREMGYNMNPNGAFWDAWENS